MTARQALPGAGKRVVLVIPGADPAKFAYGDDKRLAGALRQIATLGWDLAAVVPPERHMDGLQMVLDGVADVVMVTRTEDFPMVVLAADLGRAAGQTQRILRPESQGAPSAGRTDGRSGEGRPERPPRLVSFGVEPDRSAGERSTLVDRPGKPGVRRTNRIQRSA